MSIIDDLNASLARINLSQSELSRRSTVPQPTISRFMQGRFGAEPFLRFLDALGARIVFPEDSAPARDACFVTPRIISAAADAPAPESGDYLAVPLVAANAVQEGPLPTNSVESWVLINRKHHSTPDNSSLVAVEIDPTQRAMMPTLHPGDIVLVDRSDWGQEGFASPGNIFLVRKPGNSEGLVRRVAFSGRDQDAILTFYSDNVAECEPEPRHLRQYGGNIRNAIFGRIVWAWTDVSRK